MTERTITELREQPEAVARVSATASAQLDPWLSRLKKGSPIVFLARGTSDNAARYGGYLLGVRNGRLTSLVLPSVVTMYKREDIFATRPAIVAISQSGQSPDLIATLAAARRQGSPTLAITNAPDSPLAVRELLLAEPGREQLGAHVGRQLALLVAEGTRPEGRQLRGVRAVEHDVADLHDGLLPIVEERHSLGAIADSA
jgi:glucosamine--fructose-6-phosphate aminotransferase (isomerizing)